jgi:hypothetical protein
MKEGGRAEGRERERRTNVIDEEGNDPLFEDHAFLVLNQPEEGLGPPAFIEGKD